MRECNNSKIHISSNFLLSICLIIMLDTLLLVPSLHCNTSLHFTTLHQTTLNDTSLFLIYTSLLSITLSSRNNLTFNFGISQGRHVYNFSHVSKNSSKFVAAFIRSLHAKLNLSWLKGFIIFRHVTQSNIHLKILCDTQNIL